MLYNKCHIGGEIMTKLEKDLEIAHALIQDTNKYREYYSLFEKMWPFATINMKGYLEPFELENKKCMTIQGSSDHIFELFLKHPEKIIGIDSNPLTEYYYYLKQAAFAVLENSEQYLKFFRWIDYPSFCKNNMHVFDKDIFEEICKYLQGEAKVFWEELFICYDPKKIRKGLFNEIDETNNNALYKALNYLSEDNYQYIRKNREKINFQFLNTDIRNIDKELTETFDFITLSNIIIYAHYMYKENHIQEYKKLIELLSKKLNKDGNIVAGYLYDVENEEDYRDIYNKSIRDSIFYEPTYKYCFFKKMRDLHCARDTENHDACLIYTKK